MDSLLLIYFSSIPSISKLLINSFVVRNPLGVTVTHERSIDAMFSLERYNNLDSSIFNKIRMLPKFILSVYLALK